MSTLRIKTQSQATLLLAAIITGFSLNTVADEFHYNNVLIGDRAAGMAGAYLAVSDDPSGMFYNPAGIVHSANNNLSASMNAYNITVTQYKNALGSSDWTRTSSVLLPNFFGVSQPLGKGTFGFSYAVPDSILEDQDQTFKNILLFNNDSADFTINFNNQDNTFLAGPSFAYPVSSSVSIGATVYGVSRTLEFIQNQIFDVYNDGSCTTADPLHWENYYRARTEYGIKPLIGIMMSPADKLSLGFTVAKTFPVYSSQKEQQNITSTLDATSSCNQATFTSNTTESRIDRVYPTELGFGIAWFINQDTIISGSGHYYSPLFDGGPSVINASLGLEHYLTRTIALRLGVYTNNANTPEVSSQFQNQQENVDFMGGSLSISHFTRASSLTLGIAPTYGTGRAQVIGGTQNVQEVTAYSLTMFMSSSYSY